MTDPFGGVDVPTEYQGLILTAASRWGIPSQILSAQLQVESNFNPKAVSSAGAEGIAQFEPSTAQDMGVDPWNPSSAIDGMAHLDSIYYKKYGNYQDMLAAYNAGPGAITSDGGYPSGGVTEYVTNILSKAGTALAGINIPAPLLGAGAAIPGLGTLESIVSTDLGFWTQPGSWKRVGFWALGGTLVLFGIWFVLPKQANSMMPKMNIKENIP